MGITTTISCDVCGKVKGATNHWFLVRAVEPLTVWNFDEDLIVRKSPSPQIVKIACGDACVMQLVSQYLQGGRS